MWHKSPIAAKDGAAEPVSAVDLPQLLESSIRRKDA
jgi:hypothetical protein